MSEQLMEMRHMTLVDEEDLAVTRDGEDVWVILRYPPWSYSGRDGKRAHRVVFDQESIRASDGIRISFDYRRDGYVIEQSTGAYDENEQLVWVESVFIKAWAKNVEDD